MTHINPGPDDDPAPVDCTNCDGTGQVSVHHGSIVMVERCGTCNGAGVLS